MGGRRHTGVHSAQSTHTGMLTPPPTLQARSEWRALDFLSDVHLHSSDPEVFAAWSHHLAHTSCDALFILGDLFEIWIGDDVLDDAVHGHFWQACVEVLRQTSARMPVFFMVGNRDFLAGDRLLRETGMTGLSDPTILTWGRERWLLSHGDELCLADTEYQHFRRQVRQPLWQHAFLARPLAERLGVAQGMRQASEQRKSVQTTWADVDTQAALQWLSANQCTQLIHGHTHQAAHHRLDAEHGRHVLSDWDASSTPPRLQVLRAQQTSRDQSVQFSTEYLA